MSDEVIYKVPTRAEMKPAMDWVYDMLNRGLGGGPVVITMGREKRTLAQNSKQWPMLQDICNSLPEWHDHKMTPEDYKDLLSAAWHKQTLLPGIDGGFVALGVRTSKLTKPEFSELVELYYAFGAQHDVKWSEPSLQIYQEYREAKAGNEGP